MRYLLEKQGGLLLSGNDSEERVAGVKLEALHTQFFIVV